MNKACVVLFSSVITLSCSSRKLGYFSNYYHRSELKEISGYTQDVTSDDLTKKLMSPKNIITINNSNGIINNITNEQSERETKKTINKVVTKVIVDNKKVIPSKISRIERKSSEKIIKERLPRMAFYYLFALAFFFPPIAVLIVDGFNKRFWICLLLWMWLLVIPGIIYAMVRIFKYQNSR